MKRHLTSMAAAFVLFSVPSWAIDHNNLDAGHPLDFDDATPAAYGEQALEWSTSFVKPAKGKSSLRGDVDFLVGFARDSHLTLSVNPSPSSINGGRRQGDVGDFGIGLFHNFNREYGNTPAFSLRADASLPTGRNSAGTDFRFRAIASRHFRQYDMLHLNLDLNVDGSSQAGNRRILPGVILGYSRPLGYPKSFNQTLVAQAGCRANPFRGRPGILDLGIGMRRQVTVRSILDFGLSSEVTGGLNREQIRLTAGYSTQF